MKKLVTTLVALLPLMLLFGCGDNVENIYDEANTDGRVIATIHGVVSDGANNERLVNVTIWTSVNGAIVSTVTNAQGYYALSGLVPGDYDLTFSHPYTDPEGKALNYGVGCLTVNIDDLEDIDMEEEEHTRDFHFSVVQDVELFPLTADISGRLFKQVDPENAVPADGVTIIADFAGYDLSVDEYVVVTDSVGGYEFLGLPATADVLTRNLPFNDGTNNYDADGTFTNLVEGGAVFADPLLCDRTGIDAVVLDNNFGLNEFAVGDSLYMAFSEIMLPGYCEVTLLDAADEIIPSVVTWAADGMSVVLDPYVILLTGTTYTMDWDLITIDGVNYVDDFDFDTIDGIELIYSNVESADDYRDDFPIDSDVTLLFNMPPVLSNLNTVVELSRDGGPAVWATVSLSGNTVTVAPVSDLVVNTDYTLDYTVFSQYVNDSDTGSIDFTTANAVTIPGGVTGFAVDNAATTYDFDETSYVFDWELVLGVDGYYIYGANDVTKGDLVRVGDFAADVITGTVDLSAAALVDVFGAEPLVDGTTLSFQIAAYNAAGIGALSTAIDFTDDELPVVALGAPVGVTDNTGGTETETVTIAVTSSEPLSLSADPTWTITEAGGDGAYVLPITQVTWVLDGDRLGGVLTLIIPADVDASGDTFEILGATDSSGNEQDATVQITVGL